MVAALTSSQIAVVVNTADPKSMEIGEYYARRRDIPKDNMVFVTLPVGQGQITRQEFESAKAQLDAHVPAAVQALALAWTTPFRVDCLSVTTAFALMLPRLLETLTQPPGAIPFSAARCSEISTNSSG